MGVALGAVDRDARERADRIGDHVVAIEVPGDLAVGLRLGNLAVSDEVPRPGRDEADPLLPVGRAGIEHVSRDLLGDEPGVRPVFVERPDDVVTVGPRVGTRLVLVVAVGVAVVDDVEPVTRPSFTVARRREQPIDEPLVGLGIRVDHERVHLLGRRRQAREVERHAAHERATVRDGRGLETRAGEPLPDEGVDRVAVGFHARKMPEGVDAGRHRRRDDRLPRPVVEPRIAGHRIIRGRFVSGPRGTGVDPADERPHVVRRERLPVGRHPLLAIRGRDPPHQFARRSLAGHDGRPELSTGEESGPGVESES